MEKGYTGKIGLKAVQVVKAPVQKEAGKKPKVVKGGDLRVKSGK